ncbi:unnamed protein product, partial [Vitis vinifera]
MCAEFPVLVHGLYYGSEYLTPAAVVVGEVGYTPPGVSEPRERGVTSNNSRSWTFSLPSPLKIVACIVAP